MPDVRILGRFETAGLVEPLDQSAGRLILCSRDFARGEEKLVLAEVSEAVKAPFFGGHGASAAVDGNRHSYMRPGNAAEWVRLTIDTQTNERKALLFMEYPEDEYLEPAAVELSESAEGPWNDVTTGMTKLHAGRRWGMWRLPFSGGTGAIVSAVTQIASAVSFTVSEAASKTTIICTVMSGNNKGQTRRIVKRSDWNVTIEKPFAEPLTVGTGLLFTDEQLQMYLRGRLARVKIKRTHHASGVPFRLVGLSLFDYSMELSGDKEALRRVRAPNPSGADHEVFGGVVHRGLRGARWEQWGGPKERIGYSWAVACDGFASHLLEWLKSGLVGLVDENHRYLQGYVEPGYSYSTLPIDMSGRREVSARLTFQET